MMKYLKSVILIGCFFMCLPSLGAKNKAVERLAEVVDSLHRGIYYPYTMSLSMTLTNVGVDKKDKMVVFSFISSQGMEESLGKMLASENGTAQMLASYDEILALSMLEAKAGFKYFISGPAADGKTKTTTIKVSPSEVSAMYYKLKNGEFSPIQPYLEMIQSTISNTSIPLNMGNGNTLSNAYIKDNEIHWVYTLDDSVAEFNRNLPESSLQEKRRNIVNTLGKNMAPVYLKEMEEKGITTYFTYLDKQGNLLFELIITADDYK